MAACAARIALIVGGLLVGVFVSPSHAQVRAPAMIPDLLVPQPEHLPDWIVLELHKNRGEARRLAARLEDRALEKEIRRLRFHFFRAPNHTELRQIGLRKLRTYADRPEAYPILLDVFRRSDHEVRSAILDMIMEQRTSDADATLLWIALHDPDPWMRTQAENRLHMRIDEDEGRVDPAIVWLLAYRLLEEDERYVGRAAGLADSLSIVQLIPHLIEAQVGGQAGAGNPQGGDKGWIMIARQVGFVSDLQPVIADSAVAFDPTISVVSEGVLLRVQDGFVTTYRTEVQVPLLRLGSRAVGYDLVQRGLGWDDAKWWDWYYSELVPALADKDADEDAQDQDQAPASATGGGG